MVDLMTARRTMVDAQLRTTDVTNLSVLAAMLEAPRERFLPETMASVAYIDRALSLGAFTQGDPSRFLMAPSQFAKLLQLAAIKQTDLVLDVGCASGYSAAVLSKIALSIVAIEENEALATHAENTLNDLAIDNVAIVKTPLNAGYEKEGPYDVILIEGGVDFVPDKISEQLKQDGRLVAVIGCDETAKACLYRKIGDTVSSFAAFNAAVPALPGFQKEDGFVFP